MPRSRGASHGAPLASRFQQSHSFFCPSLEVKQERKQTRLHKAWDLPCRGEAPCEPEAWSPQVPGEDRGHSALPGRGLGGTRRALLGDLGCSDHRPPAPLPPPHGLPRAPLSWPGCRRTFYGNHFRALAGVAHTSGLAGGRGALGGQPRWSASFSAPESFLSPGQDRDFEVADILMLNLLRFRVFSYSLELMSFLLWGLASLRGEV